MVHRRRLKNKELQKRRKIIIARISKGQRRRRPIRTPSWLEHFAGLFKRYKLIAICAVLFILIGSVTLIIVLSSPASNSGNIDDVFEEPIVSVDVANALPDDYDQVDTSEIDADTLAGLMGEGEEQADLDGSMDTKDLKIIGVIKDSIQNSKDKETLQKIEEAALMEKENGKIDTVRFYNSADKNQQIQDIRSLINNNAKAIIIDVADETAFRMLTGLAQKSNIPVVAMNAPISSGYDINLITSYTDYGKRTGEHISSKLSMGSYLDYTGDSDALESVRSTNIQNVIGTKLTRVVANDQTDLSIPQDCIIAASGSARSTLKKIIDLQSTSTQYIFPKIFVGDATAGFIKYACELQTSGVEVAPKTSPSPSPSPKPSASQEPAQSPDPIKVHAANTDFIAETASQGVGALAFEFALRLSDGKKPNPAYFQNNQYTYSNYLFIDSSNLMEFYEKYKDKPDSYNINTSLDAEEIDEMFLIGD